MLKVIKLIIALFLFLLILVGFFLFSGIKVDSFSFGKFSVSQLYLKYDKKLILEIDQLNFLENIDKKNKEITDKKSLYETLSKIPLVLDLFKKIDIERIKVGNLDFTLTLNENYIYLDNNDINLSSSLEFAGSQITMNVDSLYFKDSQITFFGKAKVDMFKDIINFIGFYNYKYVDGEVNAQLKDEIIDFYVNTTHSIKSLSFLKNFLRLDEVAEQWMYENVQGDMNLHYLYGKVDLKNKKLLEDSIKGEATINNAKISFNKKAKSVNTKKLTINYKHNNLYFDLENPTYNKSKLSGSKVHIENLTSLQKGLVVIDLKTNTKLNDDILEILKAFRISLPLEQIDGKVNSSLKLKIPYLSKYRMEVNGEFIIKNANLKLNKFDFFVKDAKVILKDNIIDIVDSNVSHKDLLKAKLKLTIDTKANKAKGETFIESFNIVSNDTKIVNLKGLKSFLEVDFNNNTTIDIKKINTLLEIKEKAIEVKIDDLKKVEKYSEVLTKSQITSGKLLLNILDEENISFILDTQNLNFPIYKDNQQIKEVKFYGDISKENVLIKNEDEDIQIGIKDDNPIQIELNNIDIDLSKNNEKSENKKLPNINIYLKDSRIRLDKEHQYETTWAKINIKDAEKIDFSAHAINLDLPIAKNNKKVDNLELKGRYEKGIIYLNSFDKKLDLNYNLDDEKIVMNLFDYDVLYDTSNSFNEESLTSYFITGKNSNIVINEKHVALANSYKLDFENHKTQIDLEYKNTKVKFNKNFDESISIEAEKMNDEFLNALFGKVLINGGEIDIKANGIKGIINGKTTINNSKIVDLAIINNLLILINTSPGLINPLLAIPSVVGMATNDGFNLNGYRIVQGDIDFTYNIENKFLNMHKIFTKGNGIDFDGFTTIDFKTSNVDSKLKLIFFKNYSKIVGAIPVMNYILLGDEKRVSTQVEISGTLDDPQYKTVFVEEGIKAPFNLIKRIITSPLKLFDKDKNKSEEQKENE